MLTYLIHLQNEDNKSSNQYDNSIASDTSSYQQPRSDNTERQPRQNNNVNSKEQNKKEMVLFP